MLTRTPPPAMSLGIACHVSVGGAKKLPQHERMRSWKEAVALNRELKSWQQLTDERRKHIGVNWKQPMMVAD